MHYVVYVWYVYTNCANSGKKKMYSSSFRDCCRSQKFQFLAPSRILGINGRPFQTWKEAEQQGAMVWKSLPDADRMPFLSKKRSEYKKFVSEKKKYRFGREKRL